MADNQITTILDNICFSVRFLYRRRLRLLHLIVLHIYIKSEIFKWQPM